MISIYCLKNSLNKKEKNLGYIRVDFYFFFCHRFLSII